MPERTAVLNPVCSALTSCGPMGSDRTRKFPLSSVITERVAPLSIVLTVTVVPPTAAPVASSTRPEIAPVTCADPLTSVPGSARIQSNRTCEIAWPKQTDRRPAGGFEGAGIGAEHNLKALLIDRRLRRVSV